MGEAERGYLLDQGADFHGYVVRRRDLGGIRLSGIDDVLLITLQPSINKSSTRRVMC